MIRVRYMAKTAVAGKHRRATDATNMSDERTNRVRVSAPEQDGGQSLRANSLGAMTSLFRWLRSAAFTTSGRGMRRLPIARWCIAPSEATRLPPSHCDGNEGNTARIVRSRRWFDSSTLDLPLFLIDLAMGTCFNIIVLVTVCEILGWSV